MPMTGLLKVLNGMRHVILAVGGVSLRRSEEGTEIHRLESAVKYIPGQIWDLVL